MTVRKSEDVSPAVIQAAHEIYNSINDFALKRFHFEHGKLYRMKPKRRKKKK